MTTPEGWYPDPSGKPMQRYFDGMKWTEHYAAQTPAPPPSMRMGPPNLHPHYQSAPHGARNSWPDPFSRFSKQQLVIVAVVTAVVIGTVLIIATSRDEKSYQAGRASGTDFARGVRTLSSDRISDSLIEIRCATAASLAHDRAVHYWRDGQINGSEIDKDDFKQGCIDAAKEGFRSR